MSRCYLWSKRWKEFNNGQFWRIDKTQKANRDSVFEETDPIMILRQALSSIARLRVDFDYIMTDEYERLLIEATVGANIDASHYK